MCFSVTASFTAAAALGTIGTISLLASWHKPRLTLLAVTPFIFALQQTVEGFSWLALTNPNNAVLTFLQSVHVLPTQLLVERLAFMFLLCAFFWSIWIPSALLVAEKQPLRRKALMLLLAVGATISLILGYQMLYYGTATTTLIGHSISYDLLTDVPLWEIGVYCIAVIVPSFISSLRFSALFGVLILASCIASYLLWYATFTSVWCFFAALLSGLVVVVISKN